MRPFRWPITRSIDVISTTASAGQHVLKYTEYGGYYVDPRGRRLNPDLIADEAQN